VRALVALGYQPGDAERAVRRALEGAPTEESTADLVRRSLAALGR
jgi:Holliday junction resolvasome RuvABC DNA-binding subunit